MDYQYPKDFRDVRELKLIKKIKLEDPDGHNKIRTICQEGAGNLIFAGKTGRGKTFAACLCCEAIKSLFKLKSYEIGFCNVAELRQEWKETMNEAWKQGDVANRLKEFKVLVLDDLGTCEPSQQFLDYFYLIIKKRTEDKNLMNIYTTNLSADELGLNFGARIVSRIINHLNLKVVGEDQRKKLNF